MKQSRLSSLKNSWKSWANKQSAIGGRNPAPTILNRVPVMATMFLIMISAGIGIVFAMAIHKMVAILCELFDEWRKPLLSNDLQRRGPPPWT